MKPPRRWLEEPDVDPLLREVLRGAPPAARLDDVTRRRLAARVARRAVVPAVAAGWLLVKSAGAALGVVLGAGAVASYTGIVQWSPSPAREASPPKAAKRAAPSTRAPRVEPKTLEASPPDPASAPEPAPAPVNPTPSLPMAPSSTAGGSLSLEAALLEQARREMRAAPSVALAIASEHESRYQRGQLSAERTLIQIEALHRLGRGDEALQRARGLLGGASGGLYAERVRKLLGERALER